MNVHISWFTNSYLLCAIHIMNNCTIYHLNTMSMLTSALKAFIRNTHFNRTSIRSAITCGYYLTNSCTYSSRYYCILIDDMLKAELLGPNDHVTQGVSHLFCDVQLEYKRRGQEKSAVSSWNS